jgi:hypothetical protein
MLGYAALTQPTVLDDRSGLPLPCDPSLRPLLAWWRGLPRHDGRLPLWDLEHIFALKPWLGYLLIIRFPADGSAPWYSLYGMELVNFTGNDLTKRTMSTAATAPGSSSLYPAYRDVAQRHCPYWGRVQVELPHGSSIGYERLLLPFASRGTDADLRVLGAIRFDRYLPRDWETAQMRLTTEQEVFLQP